MPLYRVRVTIPFTIHAPNKGSIRRILNMISWKGVVSSFGTVPSHLKYRSDIKHDVEIREIMETGIG